MLTGRYDCDYVETVGVIQRAWLSSDPKSKVMYADVAIEDGVVRAAFWNYSSAADLTRFIDARVQLRGNIGTIFGRTEQLRGVSLFVGRIGDVVVLEPPPDPFLLPARSIRNIYNYSSAGEVNRRIRVRGVVTARISGAPVAMNDFTTSATFRYVVNVLYLKDATGGVRIETEQLPNVRPGDLVEAAGFPGVTPGKPILRNAVFRIAGAGSEPAPLTVVTGSALTPDHDAELVRMEGQLLSVLTGLTERVLVLRVGDTVFDAGVDVSQAGDALDGIRPGSLLSVTGVYSYQGGPPPSFRLFLRSPGDVRVLAAAPWWTLRHTAVMVAILALTACVGAFWMRALAPEAPAIPGSFNTSGRAWPGAPRHRGAGARRYCAAAGGRFGELSNGAGGGTAIARTSRGRCCAIAWRRRGDPSWISDPRRSRAAILPGPWRTWRGR